ncbi:CYFA0S05e03158g1_1 [Cyberlindnera fabianii]|uniref:CYFA0S05e03158g1_1 n=1 Tax=Cyberlindnera fabianii TaxID=36022 RepID=A0A061ASX4_CYBFA|nr:CYFA0S05e03158g1_1 [Cyberlindnera fabianii]
MPSPTITASSLAAHITHSKGQFAEVIEYSLEGQQFFSTRISIDAKGALRSAGSPGTQDETSTIVIRRLHSCLVQLQDASLIVTPYSEQDPQVWLRPGDKDVLSKLIATLIFWQSLRPRGILHKQLDIPFDAEGTNEANLLVASCKIYGPLPKNVKNIVPVQGPIVPLYTDANGPIEQWFTAMAVLKSNGVLELINESDGKVLYSIDIKLLKRSEVREVHHSIFESSNYLFVGAIEEMRLESLTECQYTDGSILPQISKQLPKVTRIIMEFPYRIDVEDWLVALKSFTVRQYVGLSKSNLFRVSRRLKFDILEAGLSEERLDADGKPVKLYAEIQMWGAPWYRTAIVDSSRNPFFREEFELDLPLNTKSFTVALKQASAHNYQQSDIVIGSAVLSYEEFHKDQLQTRFPLLQGQYSQVGQICISIRNKTNYILPPESFNNFEQILLNLNFKQLLNYVVSKHPQSDLESTAVVLLDIFQSLQKENEFFSALINDEITKIMDAPAKSANLYNSLFRGNSLLTKSLELYNLRVGQEYLEKVIGNFITGLISSHKPTEIDPMRIREADPALKKKAVDSNFQNLLHYAEEVWKRIYQTSNDLPDTIKQQLTILRKQIELYTNDETITLNCITGFIFLRFFCPVILNPKLFFLTKEHQTGDISRTLTLISKILLTFSNRSMFGAKEPYMERLNDAFITPRTPQLMDYLDKITGKKLDFTDKRLKLSSSLERADIILTSKDLLKELPTVPFLIDKYLRLDQLADLVTNEVINPDVIDDFGEASDEEVDPDNSSTNLYKIGSLEFEKLVLDKKEGDGEKFDFEFGSEKFIKTLLDTSDSDGVYSYINANSSLKDIIIESDRLSSKKARLAAKLCTGETASDIIDINKFSKSVLSTTILDPQRRIMKAPARVPSLRYLNSDSSLNFKFRFRSSSTANSSAPYFDDDGSSSVTGSQTTRSPTKKLSMMIKSASISSFQTALSNNEEKRKTKLGRWFKKKGTE